MKNALIRSEVAFRNGAPGSTRMIRCCSNITIASGGVPFHSDPKHFEVLLLSGAQTGLNWSIVLKKREGYRRAFDSFDPRG